MADSTWSNGSIKVTVIPRQEVNSFNRYFPDANTSPKSDPCKSQALLFQICRQSCLPRLLNFDSERPSTFEKIRETNLWLKGLSEIGLGLIQVAVEKIILRSRQFICGPLSMKNSSFCRLFILQQQMFQPSKTDILLFVVTNWIQT